MSASPLWILTGVMASLSAPLGPSAGSEDPQTPQQPLIRPAIRTRSDYGAAPSVQTIDRLYNPQSSSAPGSSLATSAQTTAVDHQAYQHYLESIRPADLQIDCSGVLPSRYPCEPASIPYDQRSQTLPKLDDPSLGLEMETEAWLEAYLLRTKSSRMER